MRSSGFILALSLCVGGLSPSSARAVGNAGFITRLWQMEAGPPHNNVRLIKKEIAATLSLSYHTIDTHLRNFYQKLHVHAHGRGGQGAERKVVLKDQAGSLSGSVPANAGLPTGGKVENITA